MSRSSTSRTQTFTDPDDAPPVTQADIDRAVFRVGGQPVERRKVPVQVMLDSGIVQFFKDQAGNEGFQSLINKALDEYVRGHELETMLRRVIREEMRRSA